MREELTALLGEQAIARMVSWRQWLHLHPELSFQEYKTSGYIAERLGELGIAFETGFADTGIVGVIEGALGEGPTIGLRADFDALPIDEDPTIPGCSLHTGRMHACGHDGHAAMLLGAAAHLSANRDFAGRVVLIFQPAEEGGGGGERMVNEGLFDRYPCDQVYALHNVPQLPLGYAAVHRGVVFAGYDEFSITVVGKGGHSGALYDTVNPLIVASGIVQAMGDISARRCNPSDPATISISDIRGGAESPNVVPVEATVRGSVRSFSESARDVVSREIEVISNGVAATYNASAKVTYDKKYPPLKNHSANADFAAECLANILGPDNVIHSLPPFMASEDFSFMLNRVPGAYILLGQGQPGCTAPAHSPEYRFNDALLPFGAAYFVELVKQSLGTRKENGKAQV